MDELWVSDHVRVVENRLGAHKLASAGLRS